MSDVVVKKARGFFKGCPIRGLEKGTVRIRRRHHLNSCARQWGLGKMGKSI